MPYERKNIVFYEQNLSLQKIILLIMFFVIEFSFTTWRKMECQTLSDKINVVSFILQIVPRTIHNFFFVVRETIIL